MVVYDLILFLLLDALRLVLVALLENLCCWDVGSQEVLKPELVTLAILY